MFSIPVILAALSFWAPYTADHRPVCGGDPANVTIHVYADDSPTDTVDGLPAAAWRTTGSGRCEFSVAEYTLTYPASEQATIVAHELGGTLFGLGDSDDPTSIMDAHAELHPPGVFRALDRPARRIRTRRRHGVLYGGGVTG